MAKRKLQFLKFKFIIPDPTYALNNICIAAEKKIDKVKTLICLIPIL